MKTSNATALLTLFVGLAATMAGCEAETPAAGSAEQSIVRGVAEPGRPYVVALLTEKGDNTAVFCSGTYIAPRTVLTAAHCIPSVPIRRILAYYGSSYPEDLQNFVSLPPAGSSSVWAQAENWTLHPEYDASLIYPDLAVVYLDRELPMAPLPVDYRLLSLNDFARLATIVGWGASEALTKDIQVTEGSGEKRSGLVPFLGSPWQYPKPADPHPGLNTARVRDGLALFGGFSPFSNGCTGDSGGPAILRVNGEDRLVGVASWTGNWCETYSYYTRMSGQETFLKQALAVSGDAPIVPSLDCVSENADGTLRAHLGYQNPNRVTVTVPVGARNVMAVDTAALRPTVFRPGEKHFAGAVDFPRGGTLTWKLVSPAGQTRQLKVNAKSPRCVEETPELLTSQACAAGDRAGCGQSHQDCMAATLDMYAMAPDCAAEQDALMRCQAGVLPDAFLCMDNMAYLVGDCMEQSDAWFVCAFPE